MGLEDGEPWSCRRGWGTRDWQPRVWHHANRQLALLPAEMIALIFVGPLHVGDHGSICCFLLKGSLRAVSVRLRGGDDEHRRVAVALLCTYSHTRVLLWSWVSGEPREVDTREEGLSKAMHHQQLHPALQASSGGPLGRGGGRDGIGHHGLGVTVSLGAEDMCAAA